ncbi:MAG: hypothetical protein A4E54_01631 [Pelotomaculum sp. PtaB.Bin117]|nr:MAG: hypothetical protein A4E54_01631 [Pelotomaculum sp. PtaB.Bin117]OPY60629.1 MAG: hypothetical protein A4E56_02571 [Pelotomaculum sp. PtaU1.Bin065]
MNILHDKLNEQNTAEQEQTDVYLVPILLY